MLDVCLLGPSGMMPMPGRWLSVLLVRYNGSMIMIDCGEGTQIPLKELGWGFTAIDTLLITHYHADHIAGLPGFLLTLGNFGDRTKPLHIYGPPGLLTVVRALMVIAPIVRYKIILHELPDDESVCFEASGLQVSALPVDHGATCLAYSLYVPRSRRFDPDKAREIGLPLESRGVLQKGGTVEFEGRTIVPDQVMGPPRKGLKITYCTDSRPIDVLVPFAEGAELLVCEGMYGDDAKQERAVERGHMTMREAAGIARQAGVRCLWLTHFSPSVTDPQVYLDAVREVFPSTIMGSNLLQTRLFYPDEE